VSYILFQSSFLRTLFEVFSKIGVGRLDIATASVGEVRRNFKYARLVLIAFSFASVVPNIY
jgi:hypothetical protein